jgi:hypothetical protein
MAATHQTGTKTPVYCIRTVGASILTQTFNSLWCDALNEREHFSEFCMLHDDVSPIEPGWLDVLNEERIKAKADVISTVIPIKDDRGLTSIAMWNPTTNRMTRITMTQACKFPKTFDGKAAGYPGCVVLPNTGLWLCDFTKPWVEKVTFTIRDRNFKASDGTWVTQCFSEDWHFGIQAYHLGLKVVASSAVKVIHHGTFKYPNFEPWGGLKVDEAVNHAPLDIPEGPRMPEPIWEKK